MNNREQVLVVGGGAGRLISSVTTCLLQAGHPVTLCTDHESETEKNIDVHLKDLKNNGYNVPEYIDLQVEKNIANEITGKLVIIISEERVDKKKNLIERVEKSSSSKTIIAVNTESISLEVLQNESKNSERIVGLNWVEPAHTTVFLELIKNEKTSRDDIDDLLHLSGNYWDKDPYVVTGNYGIRSKMLSAMAREAFYLVENGYASVEDIDRACRNDAGYYLPFAGNCRYMDLMGTYIYGVVMEELNPDLSKNRDISPFFNKIIDKGGKGMENGAGFYHYDDEKVEKMEKTFRKFSYQIKQVMDKYPFDY